MATLPEIAKPKKRKAQNKKSKRKKRANRETISDSNGNHRVRIDSDHDVANLQGSGSTEREPQVEFNRTALLAYPLSRDALIDCWPEWQNYLKHRQSQTPDYARNLGKKESAFLWGVADQGLSEDEIRLITVCRSIAASEKATKSQADLVESWFESIVEQDGSLGQVLGLLAIVEALPWLSRRIEGTLWCRIASRVDEEIELAAHLDLLEMPVERVLRAIELPLYWASAFPELEESSPRLDTVGDAFHDSLRELLDGEGAVRARDLPIISALLATWTRAVHLASSLPGKFISKEALIHFEWFVREALRWTRPDRTQFFADDSANSVKSSRSLIEAAIRVSPDKDDRKIAKFYLDLGGKKPVVNLSTLPDASGESAWAETAILHGSWHPNDPTVAIDHSQPNLKLELFRYQSILLGDVTQQLVVDGRELSRTGSWNQVCWHDDDDVSFLEIESLYEERIAIQRQIVLAKQDRFLLVSDAVLCKEETQFSYQLNLPVARSCSATVEKESREGLITSGKKSYRLMPLSAPEWRAEPSDVELETDESSITLSMETRARRAYMPLFIDLEPRRAKKPFTWRRLTVAKDRVIESPQDSVGFRVQVGDEQWLVFRSLAPMYPRTVLGEHIGSEFYLGQFFGDGQCVELISVDSDG